MAIYDTQKEGQKMEELIVAEILTLKEMSIDGLQKKYEEVFNGKKTASANKTYLWRRITYRIQELKCGGLSEKARNEIGKLIKEYDPINNRAIRQGTGLDNSSGKSFKVRDGRLPIPGTIITKEYKGAMLQVKVLEKGFERNGRFFKSLTGLTKEITGSHWSGYNFFDL
jgi:hypothetical protein